MEEKECTGSLFISKQDSHSQDLDDWLLPLSSASENPKTGSSLLRHSTRSPQKASGLFFLSCQPHSLPGTLPPSYLVPLASLGYYQLMIPEENDHENNMHIHSTSLCAKQCCESNPRSVTSSPWCPPCCVVRKKCTTHDQKGKVQFPPPLRTREKEAEHGRDGGGERRGSFWTSE